MTSQFDADSNLWNGVSGHKDDCHVRCKSLPTLVYKRLHDMIIRIIKYDGTEHLLSCDSFEFRTNQVSNWIKIKQKNEVKIIHGVAVIKSVS